MGINNIPNVNSNTKIFYWSPYENTTPSSNETKDEKAIEEEKKYEVAKEKLDAYKKSINDIYSTDISGASCFPNNIQILITQIKTSYCNPEMLNMDVEKSKERLNSIMNEFYQNIGELTSENYVQAINRMSAAISFTKERTQKWLQSRMIKDESGNAASAATYSKTIKDYNNYFTELQTKFATIQKQASDARYKSLITVNLENKDDVNKIPTDYSERIAELKAAMGDKANLLTFEGAKKPEDLASDIQKVKKEISVLITEKYEKFFSGKSSDAVNDIANKIKSLSSGNISVEDDSSIIMNQIREYVSSFYSQIANMSIEDKIRAMHEINASLVITQNEIKEKLQNELNSQKIDNHNTLNEKNKELSDKIGEYTLAFNPIYQELNKIPEALTKEIRELNYISEMYDVPTNLSEEQISKLQASMATFISNPTDETFYSVSEATARIDKENIDYQEQLPKDLEENFEKLSRTIGDGLHVSSETVIGANGLAEAPSTPGTIAREELREKILAIKNRGEFGEVELATLLQRELKAIQSAQQFELKVAEEDFYNKGNPDKDIQSIKDLNEKLKKAEEDYQNELENFSKYFYDTTGTISGSWSGYTSGSLKGSMPIENNVGFEQLKATWENKINTLKDELAKAKESRDSELQMMKQAFEYETRDIIDALSKLGIVTTVNYNL